MTSIQNNHDGKQNRTSAPIYTNVDKCKSTTYLENKTSRITKSFIKTNYTTMSSNKSNEKGFKKSEDDSNIQFTNNLITEFFDEENGSIKDDKSDKTSKIITFSLFIEKHPKLMNEKLPLLLKESFEINADECLSKAIILFIRIINKSLKDKDLKITVPRQCKIRDLDYQVKPMKKSGKPDFDLPAFDLNTPIKSFCFNAFSLVFKDSFLSNLSRESTDTEIKHVKEITIEKPALIEKRKESVKVSGNKEIPKKSESSSCCNSCIVF